MWRTVGFNRNKSFFKRAWQSKTLGQSFLFTGQEMIGKKTFAQDLVRLINSWPDSLVNHPDCLEFDQVTPLTIAEARQIKHFFSRRPHSSPRQAVIIDNAERLRPEPANALLKILEEPPAHGLLILVTSRIGALPATIVSRCLEIKFLPLSRAPLEDYLISLKLSAQQAAFLYDFSNGRLGLALQLRERGAFAEIKQRLVEFNGLLRGGVLTRLNYAEKIFSSNTDQIVDVRQILLYWIFYLRSKLSARLKVDRAKLLRQLLSANYRLDTARYNQRLVFENLLLNL